MRLHQFPYVRVRIACRHCPHKRGDYSLARLAERFGADADVEMVLFELTRACKWQVPPATKHRKYEPYCRAYLRDLDGGREPDKPHDHAPPNPPRLRLVL
jgi:hypothetical protein